MAKNTKEGALQTEALVYQSIIEIFFQDGWDAVTYGAIAKHTGLSRSGIQRVVPSKDSMVDAFQGQVVDYVNGLIDASSPETIKASWLAGLEQEKFAHCVRFLLGSVYMETQAKQNWQWRRNPDRQIRRKGHYRIDRAFGTEFTGCGNRKEERPRLRPFLH